MVQRLRPSELSMRFTGERLREVCLVPPGAPDWVVHVNIELTAEEREKLARWHDEVLRKFAEMSGC